MRPSNLSGSRFGKLLVQERVENRHSKTVWRCLCDCGNIKDIVGQSLISMKTKSCGCLKVDSNKARKTHGDRHSPEYCIWSAMLTRCRNRNFHAYDDYGGRGIEVCDRWDSYENFLQDMGRRKEGETLDRINNDGNYEPSNCRWASRYEQARNRRSTRIIEFNGIKKCLLDWAADIGITHSGLERRLKKFSIEEALTKPKRTK